MHALIRDGVVVDYADSISPGSLQEPRGGKPYWLPVVDDVPQYDADAEVLDESIEVGASQVTRTYTARARTADEWAALRAPVLAGIEMQYTSRWQAPIDYAGHTWHGNQEAADNISGVLDIYREMERMGQEVPASRSWTPYGSLTGVTLTRNELAGLGIAIGVRKDALFVLKKQMQAAIAALTSVAALEAYDVTAGWE